MSTEQQQVREFMNLNELAAYCHKANAKWWQNIDTGEPIDRNKFELLALAVSEVSEALEGERKNLMDDKLPHRKMAEVEMADAKIRLLDFAAGFKINLIEDGIFESLQRDLTGSISNNKGEALFWLMSMIIVASDSEAGRIISTAIAYIHAYCEKHGYDLDGAFKEKMAYNATREDHTHEARRIAGGKQF